MAQPPQDNGIDNVCLHVRVCPRHSVRLQIEWRAPCSGALTLTPLGPLPLPLATMTRSRVRKLLPCPLPRAQFWCSPCALCQEARAVNAASAAAQSDGAEVVCPVAVSRPMMDEVATW